MLNSPQLVSFDLLDLVGIAIKSSPEGQNHIGILYIDEHDVVQLLHFATQNVLLNHPPSAHYFWLNLGDSFSARDRVALQGSIWDILGNISQYLPRVSFNYGFDDAAPIFDAVGQVLEDKKDIAITCASFVLNVFESIGYTLLNYDEWPKNQQENMDWQKGILEYLHAEGYLTDLQYQKQFDKVGSRRFKPEEVAASTQLPRPASLKSVLPIAQQIGEEIKVVS